MIDKSLEVTGKIRRGEGLFFSNISGVYNLIRHKRLRNNCSGCNYNAITQSIAWIQLKALCEEYHSGLQNHFQQAHNEITQEWFRARCRTPARVRRGEAPEIGSQALSGCCDVKVGQMREL